MNISLLSSFSTENYYSTQYEQVVWSMSSFRGLFEFPGDVS